MYEDVVALVPAAGLGMRLGLGPKAFLRLGGRSLLQRVVDTTSCCVCRTLVGVSSELLEEARESLGGMAEVHPGGSSRQETVYRLLKTCSEEIVLIHDVVRPFASQHLARRTIEAARAHGAAAPVTPAAIPTAHPHGQHVISCTPASAVLLPQAPQAYRRQILEQAYLNALPHGFQDQTTLELVLRLGVSVFAVPGEEFNIKITTPLDWAIAEQVIAPLVAASTAETGT